MKTFALACMIMLIGLVTLSFAEEMKAPLTFECTSLETKQSHTGGYGVQRTITASSGYLILLVDFTITNETDVQQPFSSERFRVFDNDGKAVEANFVGLKNNIAPSGATTSIEGSMTDPDDEKIVSYTGKLSTTVSFMEWNLAPRKKYSETLVFVVPSTAKDLRCEFKNLGE